MGQEELNKFDFAPRETEDDKSNNIRSLNRKLSDTLMFLCDHKIGKENVLLLPQGEIFKLIIILDFIKLFYSDKWIQGETLRQTAERIVQQKCGDELKVHFYGNAPVGFHKYKYPASERNDAVGAKIFFFRAIYKGGDVKAPNQDFMWINTIEIDEKLKGNYLKSVKSFMCA